MQNNNHYYTALFHFTNYYETNINSKITRLNFNAGYIYPGGKLRPSLTAGLVQNIYSSRTRIIEFATTKTTTAYDEINNTNILKWATGLNLTGGLNYRLSERLDLLLNLSYEVAYTKIKAYS
ncbi:MAG TPA: hypothetical protein VE870_07340 [Bacteroidales bacterium]|nr:hypothetical protein [Bacteroidales bacterium]